MIPLPNPIPYRYVELNPECTPAYDAFESSDARAVEMCVGLPCTYSIGSDSYSGKIVSVNGKKMTAEFGVLGMREFSVRTHARVRGWFLSAIIPRRGGLAEPVLRTAGRISVGVAEDRRDPSF